MGKYLRENPDTSMDTMEEEFPGTTTIHWDAINAQLLRNKPKRTSCEIKILYGPSGCGKSTWARAQGDYYAVPPPTRHNGRWDWQGYEGQNLLVIDEFDDTWLKMINIKRFFDTTEYIVEKKGKNMPMKSNKMILTTNKDPADWYTTWIRDGGDIRPLERRFTDFVTIYDCSQNPGWDHGNQNEEYMNMTLRVVRSAERGFRFRV